MDVHLLLNVAALLGLGGAVLAGPALLGRLVRAADGAAERRSDRGGL